ncbi:hypothetical protein J2I47_12255 [Fibrella sp. HMF5335]|uniref:Uncharacterized protein n=1 Tax=Fibrella rubiginis TaxID=2817060 RepID=A0A939GIE0_9BACT|nr:hypothetical protein [Fibrella rubiginis]MBO0937320.1 hypothetical protein [Fibrella rubiginis]
MNHVLFHRVAIARLLLLVQLFMLTNAVVFRHAHRLPDGTLVVHAHPFLPKAPGPIQPLDHSKQELIWLDAVAHTPYLFYEVATFQFIPDVVYSWPTKQTTVPATGKLIHTFVYFSHRGPPLV